MSSDDDSLDTDLRSWSPAEVIPGTPYELLEQPIAEGGYGRIYKVRHTMTGRVSALKALHRDLTRRPDVLERFRQEVKVIATILPHPNVVDIYDANYTADGRFYYVMELLEGQNLRQTLRAVRKLPPDQTCQVMRQVLHALAKAHAFGIVHRDIKPDNIFLVGDPAEPPGLVKLLDFGVAKVFGETTVMTAPGAIIGTSRYFAPENVLGENITPKSDLYAWGVTFWETLTGIHPFPHETEYAVLNAIVKHGVPSLDVLPRVAGLVPPAVREVVRRATLRDPNERYPSVIECMTALDEAMIQLGIPASYVPDSLRYGASASYGPPPRLDTTLLTDRNMTHATPRVSYSATTQRSDQAPAKQPAKQLTHQVAATAPEKASRTLSPATTAPERSARSRQPRADASPSLSTYERVRQAVTHTVPKERQPFAYPEVAPAPATKAETPHRLFRSYWVQGKYIPWYLSPEAVLVNWLFWGIATLVYVYAPWEKFLGARVMKPAASVVTSASPLRGVASAPPVRSSVAASAAPSASVLVPPAASQRR